MVFEEPFGERLRGSLKNDELNSVLLSCLVFPNFAQKRGPISSAQRVANGAILVVPGLPVLLSSFRSAPDRASTKPLIERIHHHSHKECRSRMWDEISIEVGGTFNIVFSSRRETSRNK